MKKNMLFFNLMDAMTGDLCPVCQMTRKRTLQMMDSFLYEGVNDSENRQIIAGHRGFCARHGKMLMEMGNPLAHAIIYQDLLRLSLSDLRQNDLSRYADEKDCFFCSGEKKTESAYLSTFADAFNDKDFQEKYREGGMLCIPHLKMLQEMKTSSYPCIRQITEEKYQKLLQQLGQIIHKNDYRFCGEPWEKGAKDSWKRAVQTINRSLS